MERMAHWVHATAVACILGAAVPAQDSQPPPLNPERAHVRVFLNGAPDLRFYPRRDLTGQPAIGVNGLGAFVHDKRECTWPGGAYDAANQVNMVLGYQLLQGGSVDRYVPCPASFPVISKWAGFGGAALYIEIFGRKGPVIEVKFRGRSYYMDLRSLPGRSCGPEYSCGVKDDKVITWERYLPEVEAIRLRTRAALQLRRDPLFARFLEDVRRCLLSSAAPQCFADFVEERLPYSEANPEEYDITAERFIAAAWGGVAHDGRRFAEHLTACFITGDLGAGHGALSTAATFTTEDGWTCDLHKAAKGWRLVRFLHNPDGPPAAF
jgi:hypothetical protein